MTYELTLIQNPSYIHIIVTGENNQDNVTQYLKDVLFECITRKCKKVLIEERLTGPRLNTLSVFDIANEGSDEASGYFDAIAYVDVYAEGELMKFAETVALNRGLPVRVFATVADAEKWLNNLPAKADDSTIKE